jgi:hypothetical protein
MSARNAWGVVVIYLVPHLMLSARPVRCANDVNHTVNISQTTVRDAMSSRGSTSDALFLQVYSDIFILKDGSTLANTDTRALDTMRASVQRLLAVGSHDNLLAVARGLSDHALLRVLFLAVAGEFTVAQPPTALQQRCALVVDASSGELVLRDSQITQSVILEVLLIVSIVCLMRAWGGRQS